MDTAPPKYESQPAMTTAREEDTASVSSASDAPRNRWDPQTWTCLAMCNGTMAGADCFHLVNVCCGAIAVGIGECIASLTGCLDGCCTGCADCCQSCCQGGNCCP
ncbi:Protein of unknown function [Pyronema omphalodes CBS 100304]|uniref:Uncharacterized protein n=1 Tax=Pyronema omphalodes (strain CBS 100304) TaxID=1076935 RepID=U4LNN5_PYROM|nr:Protein of unknown function [Pyronema omphalodes CBS 100304]